MREGLAEDPPLERARYEIHYPFSFSRTDHRTCATRVSELLLIPREKLVHHQSPLRSSDVTRASIHGNRSCDRIRNVTRRELLHGMGAALAAESFGQADPAPAGDPLPGSLLLTW